MSAATADRNTPRRAGTNFAFPVKAATKIYAGTLVTLEAGLAVPGKTAVGLVAVGIAEETVDNLAGANGAVTVPVRRGDVWRFDNSAAADQITLADVGKDAYIVDDQTVAKTSATDTRSVAGTIRDVDAGGVWVAL